MAWFGTEVVGGASLNNERIIGAITISGTEYVVYEKWYTGTVNVTGTAVDTYLDTDTTKHFMEFNGNIVTASNNTMQFAPYQDPSNTRRYSIWVDNNGMGIVVKDNITANQGTASYYIQAVYYK